MFTYLVVAQGFEEDFAVLDVAREDARAHDEEQDNVVDEEDGTQLALATKLKWTPCIHIFVKLAGSPCALTDRFSPAHHSPPMRMLTPPVPMHAVKQFHFQNSLLATQA